LKYEAGLIAAEGDFVIVHGRLSGFGAPVNWIAADIVRIENGVLVEHWDVIQDGGHRSAIEKRRSHVRKDFSKVHNEKS
jgi:predicted SnoaL-like aldol condensation-catalyzing enzyme